MSLVVKKVPTMEDLLEDMEAWKLDGVIRLVYNKDKETRSDAELVNEAIQRFLDEVNENYPGSIGDCVHGWADKYAEVNGTDVFRWYSMCDNFSEYADKCMNIYSFGKDQGLSEDQDIIKILQNGMYLLLREFAELVLSKAGIEPERYVMGINFS